MFKLGLYGAGNRTRALLNALIQADGKTISAGQLALLVFGNEE